MKINGKIDLKKWMKIQTPRLRGRKGRGSGDGQGADLFKASPPWTGRNTHTHTHSSLSFAGTVLSFSGDSETRERFGPVLFAPRFGWRLNTLKRWTLSFSFRLKLRSLSCFPFSGQHSVYSLLKTFVSSCSFSKFCHIYLFEAL